MSEPGRAKLSYAVFTRGRWPVIAAAVMLVVTAGFGAKMLIDQGAAEQAPRAVQTQELTEVDAGQGSVTVPASLSDALDLRKATTATRIGDTTFVVAPGVAGASVGARSLDGTTCFAMIVADDDIGSQFGCNPAASVSRDGLGFSFIAPDGTVSGAVLLPEGYGSAALNGRPIESPGGVVSYQADKGEPVIVTADGPRGPITRRP